ncbi:MAG: dienelactone hydrolase family protein [Sulfuriflexus sp.]|nr:dienelactone hydrolase family protein [Sulfuriflexus sp.]
MSETLEAVIIEPAGNPQAVVIWLHGLGADGYDFEPIVPELGLPDDAAIKFIFPHAPEIPVTVNGGYVMRAWYDIAATDLGEQQDAEGIKRSQQQLINLIEKEIAQGIPAEKIILAGFSQGGAVILQVGLRYPQRLGGIMVLSSYVPLSETLAAEKHSANQSVPIFYAHGEEDDIIPISFAEQSRDLLLAQGYKVEWSSYAMPHAVVPDEIDAIGVWLRKVLEIN